MNHTYAVILAGGRGERFWPLSIRSRPKQFISLFGGKPLLTLAVERLHGVVAPANTFIITSRDLVQTTLEAVHGIPAQNVIGEPCGRDTAAAVALACGLVKQRDPDGVVCILTADQLMTDVATFRQTLQDSVKVARARDAIVTIGIDPTYPSTGFGYIEAGQSLHENTITLFNDAMRFVEKPNLVNAERYLASGHYYWNAGMFIWRCSVMLKAFAEQAPDMAELAETVAATPAPELDSLLDSVYPELRKISIDYAVMEKASNIVMARGTFGWDDVGTWPAIAGHFAPDTNGNIILGACEAMNAENNIVVSENRLTALIGVRGLVVVQSENATLVCPREMAQDVKLILSRIARRPDGEKYV